MTNATQALSSALLYILSGTAMSMCGLLTMLAGAIYGTIILLASAGKMLAWVPHSVVCNGMALRVFSLRRCRPWNLWCACHLSPQCAHCRSPGWGDHRAAGMQPLCHGVRRLLCGHERSSGWAPSSTVESCSGPHQDLCMYWTCRTWKGAAPGPGCQEGSC